MQIVYDAEKNILQIVLSSRTVAETAQISPDLVLDYDEDGQVVGLEFRNASQRIDIPLRSPILWGQPTWRNLSPTVIPGVLVQARNPVSESPF